MDYLQKGWSAQLGIRDQMHSAQLIKYCHLHAVSGCRAIDASEASRKMCGDDDFASSPVWFLAAPGYLTPRKRTYSIKNGCPLTKAAGMKNKKSPRDKFDCRISLGSNPWAYLRHYSRWYSGSPPNAQQVRLQYHRL